MQRGRSRPKSPEPFSPPPETKDPVKQHSDPVSKTTDEPDSGAKDQEQRPVGVNNAEGGGTRFAAARELGCREEETGAVLP